MITVISPAKTLDFETQPTTSISTVPDFLPEANALIRKLRTVSQKRLMALMDISADLAHLNVQRYLQYDSAVSMATTKQAILAFDGDVYVGMEARNFDESDLEFAQQHLRILSGLYGLLRPLDRIQPYRLEMGTQLSVGRAKNLYQYWSKRISTALNTALDGEEGPRIVLNLASQEYFGAVDPKILDARIVTPVFWDRKGDQYKVVSFWAKKARGKMAAWIVQNRTKNVADVQAFEGWGYAYNPSLSSGDQWVFSRENPA